MDRFPVEARVGDLLRMLPAIAAVLPIGELVNRVTGAARDIDDVEIVWDGSEWREVRNGPFRLETIAGADAHPDFRCDEHRRLTAVGRDDAHIGCAIGVRGVREPLAVWRPGSAFLVGFLWRELARLATVRADTPSS